MPPLTGLTVMPAEVVVDVLAVLDRDDQPVVVGQPQQQRPVLVVDAGGEQLVVALELFQPQPGGVRIAAELVLEVVDRAFDRAGESQDLLVRLVEQAQGHVRAGHGRPFSVVVFLVASVVEGAGDAVDAPVGRGPHVPARGAERLVPVSGLRVAVLLVLRTRREHDRDARGGPGEFGHPPAVGVQFVADLRDGHASPMRRGLRRARRVRARPGRSGPAPPPRRPRALRTARRSPRGVVGTSIRPDLRAHGLQDSTPAGGRERVELDGVQTPRP